MIKDKSSIVMVTTQISLLAGMSHLVTKLTRLLLKFGKLDLYPITDLQTDRELLKKDDC